MIKVSFRFLIRFSLFQLTQTRNTHRTQKSCWFFSFTNFWVLLNPSHFSYPWNWQYTYMRTIEFGCFIWWFFSSTSTLIDIRFSRFLYVLHFFQYFVYFFVISLLAFVRNFTFIFQLKSSTSSHYWIQHNNIFFPISLPWQIFFSAAARIFFYYVFFSVGFTPEGKKKRTK